MTKTRTVDARTITSTDAFSEWVSDWNAISIHGCDPVSEARLTALQKAINADPGDEYQLCEKIIDGRWALVPTNIWGNVYAVEQRTTADLVIELEHWLGVPPVGPELCHEMQLFAEAFSASLEYEDNGTVLLTLASGDALRVSITADVTIA